MNTMLTLNTPFVNLQQETNLKNTMKSLQNQKYLPYLMMKREQR